MSAIRASLLCVLLCLTGCGGLSEMMGDVDNSIPPTPLISFFETAKVERVWSTKAGSGTDELYIKLTPALLDGRVFIADTYGEVAALDASSGRRIWSKDVKLPITGGPGADFSMVLLGSSEGDVVSLMPDTGEELWRARVSSEILASPREGENVVVVRTIDGKLFALDATSGERLWVYDRTVPALTLRGTSTPIIVGDSVIAGFDGGRVTALDRDTGKLIWETRVAVSRGRSELERMVDIDAEPVIYLDAMYIATFHSNVASLDLQTGSILWQRDISSHSELGVDASHVYVSDAEGNVWALDRYSGQSVWKQEKLQFRKPTGPAVIGDKVVVGDVEGYLHWIDRETGDFVARTQVAKSPILVKPTVVDDVLYAYASNGTLASYTYTDLDASEIPVPEPQTTEATTSTETVPAGSEQDASLLEQIGDIFTEHPGDDDTLSD
ncbi:MAG: outer membrane protein assembly factor BamB [Gammaproteobacteria bacterium]